MFNQEKFLEKLDTVDTGLYSMRMNEGKVLIEKAENGECMDALLLAFNYGFLKGQRATKQKFLKKKPVEVL